MNGLIGLLSVKEWTPAHAVEVTYTTAPAQETPPNASDSFGNHQGYLAYRFARVEAHGADLIVRVVKAGGAAPTMGTGDMRVFAGTAEVLQLADGTMLYVAAPTGTATGAVIWGR